LNPPVRYVFPDLLQAVQWAHSCRLQWRRFFAANGLTPYRISYEALLADRDATLLALFRALGGDHATVPPLRISKQADALSDEWHRLFLRDLRRKPEGNGVENRDAVD
ncbi:MAG: Stf0 family sulfotransferase, partial [Sphingomonas sp.]